MAVRSKMMLVAMLGVSLAGALPLLPAAVFASESGVDWLSRVSRLRRGASDEAPWVGAKVAAVDAREAKLTIAHEAIPAIEMPAMTFPVVDATLLDKVRTGDAVEVQAANQGGVVRIVSIRPQR